MIESNANLVAVAGKVIVAALAVYARLALDRLSFRGQSRRARRRAR